MKNLKSGQRLAYYLVDGLSDPKPDGIEIGMVLVDRPRGKTTTWEFYNDKTATMSWAASTRLGFAVVGADGKTPTPEPKLQIELDKLKTEKAAA